MCQPNGLEFFFSTHLRVLKMRHMHSGRIANLVSARPGGGGAVTRKLVRAKSGPGGPLFAAKIGPTPAKFGPGCQKWSGYY